MNIERTTVCALSTYRRRDRSSTSPKLSLRMRMESGEYMAKGWHCTSSITSSARIEGTSDAFCIVAQAEDADPESRQVHGQLRGTFEARTTCLYYAVHILDTIASTLHSVEDMYRQEARRSNASAKPAAHLPLPTRYRRTTALWR